MDSTFGLCVMLGFALAFIGLGILIGAAWS